MYSILKSVAKKIIPKNILVGNEIFFRTLLTPFYKGGGNECNACGTKLKRFAKLPNEELICPVCGSISRARRLLMLLNDEFIKSGDSVLDFSPSRVLYRIFNRRKDIHYFPSDFEDEFLSAYQYDITAIDAPDNKFDVIICYHILEHIEKDEKAIDELYRVLKKQGKILVQTPFKEGDIFENPNINTATQRLQHFGQEDHVRIYSVKGLVRRLEKGGFITEVRTFSVDNYFGFAENETVIVCRKIG